MFGTELIWPDGYVAVMPHITEENKVIKDITNWRNEVKIPDMTRDVDSEETVRAETRRVLETYGHLKKFIPCITYGGPGTFYPERYDWITDEINKWNLEHYGVCSEPYERPVNLY